MYIKQQSHKKMTRKEIFKYYIRNAFESQLPYKPILTH